MGASFFFSFLFFSLLSSLGGLSGVDFWDFA